MAAILSRPQCVNTREIANLGMVCPYRPIYSEHCCQGWCVHSDRSTVNIAVKDGVSIATDLQWTLLSQMRWHLRSTVNIAVTNEMTSPIYSEHCCHKWDDISDLQWTLLSQMRWHLRSTVNIAVTNEMTSPYHHAELSSNFKHKRCFGLSYVVSSLKNKIPMAPFTNMD